MGGCSLAPTILLLLLCVAVGNMLSIDLFRRYVACGQVGAMSSAAVLIDNMDGILAPPLLSAFIIRERPLASSLIAASSALCVPSFFAALFCMCGIDQPVIWLALSIVWGFVCMAIAPLAALVLSFLPWFRVSDEEPPVEDAAPSAPEGWKTSPPVLDALCCLCNEKEALPATLFACGHAFVCAECFPEVIENNLQTCPFCRSPRI